MPKQSWISKVFLSFCILMLCACASKERYYEKGSRLLQHGDYAEASINFRKAIQADETFGGAWFGLAQSEQFQGHARAAYDAFQRALTFKSHEIEATIQISNMDLGRYLADPTRPKELRDRIAGYASALLKKDSASFDGLRLMGHIALADSDVARAVDYFSRADSVKPWQPEVVTALVQCKFAKGDSKTGQELAEQLIAKRADYLPIYDILYFSYVETGQLQQAEHVLITKVSADPKNIASRLQLCRHYMRSRNSVALKNAEEELIRVAGKDAAGQLGLGDLYADFGNSEQAQKNFEAAESLDKAHKGIYEKRIASVLIGTGQSAKARDILASLVKREPTDTDARCALGILLIERDQPGDLAEAINQFQEALKAQPSSMIYRYHLGRAYAAKGDLQSSKRELLLATNLNPQFTPALLAYARVAIRNHDFQEADKYSSRVLTSNPRNPEAHLIHAAALAGMRRLTDASAELRDLAEKEPRFRNARLELGMVNLMEKKYGDAESILRSEYKPETSDAGIARGLVEVYISQNQGAKAIEFLQEQVRKSPERSDLRLLLARTAARTGRMQLAIDEFESLQGKTKDGAEVVVESNIALGQLYLQSGNIAKATDRLKRAVQLAPKNVVANTLLASALERSGDLAGAIASYRQSLAIDPANAAIQNNLADLLVRLNGDIYEALSYARAAVQKAPDKPEFADTLGMVYLRQRNHPGAVDIFQRLVSKYPTEAIYHYHLGLAYLASGNKNDAKSQLHTALSVRPDETTAAEIKAVLASSL